MNVNFILIQGIGFLGTIFYFASYQCKENKTLFRVQFVSYVLYTTHLLLLGAVTGGISYILNTIRSFCLGSDNKFLKSNREAKEIDTLYMYKNINKPFLFTYI